VEKDEHRPGTGVGEDAGGSGSEVGKETDGSGTGVGAEDAGVAEARLLEALVAIQGNVRGTEGVGLDFGFTSWVSMGLLAGFMLPARGVRLVRVSDRLRRGERIASVMSPVDLRRRAERLRLILSCLSSFSSSLECESAAS